MKGASLMPNMISPENGRKPDIVKTMQGCSVKLYFSPEDNPAVLSLTKNMLTASYAKKILSEKKSATCVDK
jgi:hypothetical protein